MQKIQTDSLKDYPAVGRFESLWPKIPKTQSNPTFITVARNVLEIPNNLFFLRYRPKKGYVFKMQKQSADFEHFELKSLE